MRRREFIALVAVAGAWPLATRAQRAGVPVVGYLSITSAATATYFVGFRDGLKDAGYVEGQNLAIEYRWVECTPASGQGQAADLTICRACSFSNDMGLRYPRAECSRLLL